MSSPSDLSKVKAKVEDFCETIRIRVEGGSVMSQHEDVTLVLVLQVLVVTANLIAAFIAFFLYEASPWNFAIAGLAVFAAIAIAISMWLNKQETDRLNAANAAGHSMLGGH
jgi:uncharacterized membrane protein YqjE